jgi:hypothetical protein
MRVRLAIVCILFAVVLSGPQAKADSCTSGTNLVANCGFETGDFTHWTVTGSDAPGELGNLYGVEGSDPFPLPGGTNPSSGSYQVFIADLSANPLSLSQILTTAPGTQYTVSFYLAQYLVGPGTVSNSFDVTLGGTPIETLTNLGEQGYTVYSSTFTATSGASTLDLTGGNDVGEFLLDDVSVTPISNTPEPATFFLTGGALFGMLVMLWRKS